MRMVAVQPSLGEAAPVHNAVKDWRRVIDKFYMPCVLVFDSYYTSAESIWILTASYLRVLVSFNRRLYADSSSSLHQIRKGDDVLFVVLLQFML